MHEILKRHTILYVEDEPDIQANIGEYLRGWFKEVHTASDGEEALTLYHTLRPDVLLLDINIPSIDGLRLAAKIREDDQSVRIIMLTAHTEQEKLLAATELRLTKYLLKPVEPRQFKEALTLLAKELSHEGNRFVKLGTDALWDKEKQTLLLHETPLSLTAKEQRLLELFVAKRSQTVHYTDIMVAVWEEALEKEISIDSVKNLVSKLRKKIPGCNIASVYGSGYILK
jgi:DNA-binding response OmpR family regulator